MAKEGFDAGRIARYALHPLDHRWCYYSAVRPLWNEPRPDLEAQHWPGNAFIVTRMMAERAREQSAIIFTSALPDYHLLRPNAVAIPVRLRPSPGKADSTEQASFSFVGESPVANLSARARSYLAALGLKNPDANAEAAEVIWMHALAVGYSPAYLSQNSDAIRQDWPTSRETLLSSADLGRQVAALLDPERSVPGVTSGEARPELYAIASISRADGKSLDVPAGDLALTAGWGYAGQAGVTMPGKGRAVGRGYTSSERAAIEEGAKALGVSAEKAFALLGGTTLDICLNDRVHWKNVPARVWEYNIGGYQVMKKWLSYREEALLGRPLTSNEAREVTHMARRIAAFLLLKPALDANYEAAKAETYEWPTAPEGS
jgi:hypothetical protein